MVLNRVWTINSNKDYIKLLPFKEHKYEFKLTEPGTYHFICGLPVELNINKSFRVTDERTKLRHRINRAASEKSKYLLKTKIHVYNKYQAILKEKRRITLKGNKIEGKAHFHFTLKKSQLLQPVHMSFRILSMGIIKRLKVHAALYKDVSPKEDERRLMRAYLKHIFEPDSIDPSERNVFTIEEEELVDTDILLKSQRTIDSNHIVTKDELGNILNKELFEQPVFRDEGRHQIDVSDTQTFKQYVRNRTMSEIKQTLMESMKSKYPKVTYHLVENPFKQDSIHPTEKESTVLSEIQIQLLNYEVLPKKLRTSVWQQRFNSKIFGHNITEIIRLCSTSPEPQLIIIQDEQDYIFGGFLSDGLHLKNRYNKEAAVNFPSIYKNTFCLTNYDIPHGYSEVFDESNSVVFTFHKSSELLLKYGYNKNNSTNRMFRMVNDKKGIAMGGPKFAFLVDNSVQYGSSGCSETYDNCILASSETFNIKAFEVWGLQKSTKFNR